MEESAFSRAAAQRREGFGSIVVGVALAVLAALAWDQRWAPAFLRGLVAILVATAAAYALVDGIQQVRSAARLEEWAEVETPRVLPPAPACPSCGARVDGPARFCSACGEPLPPAPSDAA